MHFGRGRCVGCRSGRRSWIGREHRPLSARRMAASTRTCLTSSLSRSPNACRCPSHILRQPIIPGILPER